MAATVSWFETDSEPGEQEFATTQEALARVERLKAWPQVIHIQYEVEPRVRLSMADGEVFRQGWVRDESGGWEQQYRERLGFPYEAGPE